MTTSSSEPRTIYTSDPPLSLATSPTFPLVVEQVELIVETPGYSTATNVALESFPSPYTLEVRSTSPPPLTTLTCPPTHTMQSTKMPSTPTFTQIIDTHDILAN
ncbi:hypothetical protein DFP72DRAFT_1081856 [Ephemerocybe angulata]|uniref:Uncharacterized protein n=1 Tax=Ephemerocybe angulata TaxID=980116 RepID=A0A8H6HAC5_9AGAR|nr:hypothetical protein DFP72DRAFT_1081856 [Tulosesus angulatus]